MTILEVQNLHKHYGSLKAVNGLNLQVQEGSCFGLLGPNGAGKSTTIEIIEGIKEPTSGVIRYRGQPRDEKYKQVIGIQFQSTALQDHMYVREALETFAALYQNPASIDKVIEICQLDDLLERDHRKLSGGQRQRLLLALSLINDPEILFLDEPTTGLDPQARKMFWGLIEDIKQQNKTIILTTHYMDEAYALCDEIVIVDHGQIIAEGSPRNLLDKHFKGTRVSLPIASRSSFPATFPFELVEFKDRVEFLTDDIKSALTCLTELDIDLNALELRSHTLEDLFIDLTGKQLRG